MIVLHAGECDGSLFLWGESSGDGSAPPQETEVPRAGSLDDKDVLVRESLPLQGTEVPRADPPVSRTPFPQTAEPPQGAEVPRAGPPVSRTPFPQTAEPPQGAEVPRAGPPVSRTASPRIAEPPQGMEVPRAGAYPFGASTEELARALEGMPLGIRPAGRARRMAAWLPTRGGSPVPSSGIIAEPPASRARAKVAPWTVSAHRLSTEETVDILCASLGRRTVAPGVLVGADLAYWTEVLRLAGSMVARQQFLPGLAADGKRHRAAWRPVFVGRDAEFLAGLARRMPPAGRALSESGAPRAPRRPPAEALGQVVAALTDHLVRTAAYGATPPRSRRRKHFDSIHDAWLSALKSPEGVIERSAEDVSQLASQIREWQRPVAVSASSPFRLCFRLEEPRSRQVPPTRRGTSGTCSSRTTTRAFLFQPTRCGGQGPARSPCLSEAART